MINKDHSANRSKKVIIRVSVLTTIFLLAIVVPAFAMLPMANAQSSSANPRELKWLISTDLSCLNMKFCSPLTGGPYVFTDWVSATAYSDHTSSDFVVDTAYDHSGNIVYRLIEHDSPETWKIGPGTGGPNDFIISGTNTTTLYVNGQVHTTVSKFQNHDTGIPAVPGSLDCDELFLAPCPSGVTGIQSVTLVS